MLKLASVLVLFCIFAVQAQAANVYVLNVRGAISPASADYLLRGMHTAAEDTQARLIVIEMDTPGGLDTSMRDIIKAILASPLPVVTYVSPKGARAASAGTYILYASHLAAMAPATNLGAATPVELAPAGAPEKPVTRDKQDEMPPAGSGQKNAEQASPQDPKMKKAVHDAAAYIRSLAELHGRNAEWAERAVREAVSLSADAALKTGVIDVIADDIGDLLQKIHGREVKLSDSTATLDTANLAIIQIGPDWRSRLLSVIGDPGIAYILLLLGIYGLLYEFSNPGMLFPGVVGGICLLLALFALQLLPINYTGLALIILGIALMVAEAFMPSFGALGLGGLAAFVIGSVMLIDTDVPGYGISWAMIMPLAVTTAAFIFIVARLALQARRRPVVTGGEELPGAAGEIIDDMNNEGWARVHSELWKVRSAVPLSRGTSVKVTARDGLILNVEPINPSKENDHV